MKDMVNKMNKLKLIAKEKDKHLKEAHETIKSMKFGPTFAQGTAADEVFGDPSKKPTSPDAKFKPNVSDKPDDNEDMSGEPSQKQSPRFESTEKNHAGKGKHKKGGKTSKGAQKHQEDADITNESSSAEKNPGANPDLDASFCGPQKEDISTH